MLKIIGQQYSFEPLVWKPTRISFPEGIQMLKDAGVQVTPLFNTWAFSHHRCSQ